MKIKDKNLPDDDVLDSCDLAVLESIVEFSIERIEARMGSLHDAEKQSLETLRKLKAKIERLRNGI